MSLTETRGISTAAGERWQDQAACRGLDPQWLYPEEIRGQNRRDSIIAEVVTDYCQQCPVAQMCLDESERLQDRHGIRGGYTSKERGWHWR